jgi:hypothetical protein
MAIERIPTKQGHPVPQSAGYAKGPFPPELFEKPEIIHDYFRPGQDDIVEGGTAQNNFNPPKVFKCRDCNEVVMEYDLENHMCSAEEYYGEDA